MPPTPKIPLWKWKVLIAIAVFVDGVQALLNAGAIGLIINRLITISMFLFLWLYFLMNGLKFSFRRIGFLSLGAIGEVIPVLDTLPLWTGTVLGVMRTDVIGI